MPSLRKSYPYFSLNCCTSNSGGVAVLSKFPLNVLYKHKSGNLIHFSITDDNLNTLSFIHCYCAPKRRNYYYRLILKRFNVVPESIITGDFNTNILNDKHSSYFKSMILTPLCMTPCQTPSKAKPTFYPRGRGKPKPLDWILLPPSISSLTSSVLKILPQSKPLYQIIVY